MKKVLIIEDDRPIARALTAKLTKEGFEVKVAGDGEVGIAMLSTFAPDAVLLDIVMPKKDGFEVLEHLQKDPVLKKIPVIITSNLGQKEDIDRGIKLGAKDYIIKSDMQLSEIVDKLKKMIK